MPTLVELGFAKERVASWFALGGPAGMPPALVSKVREIFIQASKDPELQKRLSENGTPIVSSTPEEMGRAMAQEWDDHAGAGQDAEPASASDCAAAVRRSVPMWSAAFCVRGG